MKIYKQQWQFWVVFLNFIRIKNARNIVYLSLLIFLLLFISPSITMEPIDHPQKKESFYKKIFSSSKTEHKQISPIRSRSCEDTAEAHYDNAQFYLTQKFSLDEIENIHDITFLHLKLAENYKHPHSSKDLEMHFPDRTFLIPKTLYGVPITEHYFLLIKLGHLYEIKNEIRLSTAYYTHTDLAGFPHGNYRLANLSKKLRNPIHHTITLYEKAAQKGIADAYFQLGYIYYHERRDEPIEIAFNYFRIAASKNVPEAHLYLGRIFQLGTYPINSNKSKMVYHYKQAATYGNEEAMKLLSYNSPPDALKLNLKFIKEKNTLAPIPLRDTIVYQAPISKLRIQSIELIYDYFLNEITQIDKKYVFKASLAEGDLAGYYNIDESDSYFKSCQNPILKNLCTNISHLLSSKKKFILSLKEPGTLIDCVLFNHSYILKNFQNYIDPSGQYISLNGKIPDYSKIQRIGSSIKKLFNLYGSSLRLIQSFSETLNSQPLCLSDHLRTIKTLDPDLESFLKHFFDESLFPLKNLEKINSSEEIIKKQSPYLKELKAHLENEKDEIENDINEIRLVSNRVLRFIEHSTPYRNHIFLKNLKIIK